MSNADRHPAADPPRATALLANPAGGYRVLPGGAAYCTGIIPDDGFEVVRVQLDPWLPLTRATTSSSSTSPAPAARSRRSAASRCGCRRR